MAEKMNDIDDEIEDEEIIELVDDDNNIIKFRLLDVTEYKGEKFALLLAAEPNDAVAEDEVAIFRFKEEEQVLEPIEDDALLNEVFEFWQNEDDGESE